VKSIRLLSGILLLVVPATGIAQLGDPSQLTLDRIFDSAEFVPERLEHIRWLATGAAYTTLEPSRSGSGRDIVEYDAASGRRMVLVPASRLVPSGMRSPLDIEDYGWSDDGSKLLVFTNSRRVWRSNTRGDYWVLDLRAWTLKKLGGYAAEASLMFAKFAPDGQRVAYVQENNIYVEHLDSGDITPLTHDGSEAIVNGTSDWVYEEEFSLRDCFAWSPDGSSIAYWQFDTEGVSWFKMINNTDSLYPKITTFPYPKAGELNSAVRVGVVSAEGGETVWLDVFGDPADSYIPRMEWAANSNEVLIQHVNRLQNTNRVLMGNVETGAIREVLVERDDVWLDVVDDLHWLEDGAGFTWVSERDGWRRVYRVTRSGDDLRPLTSGDFDVVSVTGVDEQGGWLYYVAAPENPTQRYLFRSRLDGSGEPQRLTPADYTGTHTYQIAPGGAWAIHSHSRFDLPPSTDLVRLPDHDVQRTLVGNADLRRRAASLSRGEFEFFRVDNGEGTMLDCWLMKPPDFDPSKRYPIFFYVYGEPWGQTVADRWGGSRYLWHLMLTQQGYLVASVDNRGTNSPRGRDWRKIVYRRIGVHAAADQAAALGQIGERPYVDTDRVGIWGWSGGGSMTLNMMFRYPDSYHTGLSVAPVPDVHLYDTIYQERYMGLPQQNEADYRAASPITYASQLQGNLLVIHGTGDDNVHYQGTERLVNELVQAGKQFTMMAYPNRSHGINEGEGTTLHLYTLLTDYLKEHLPAGAK
jgi:dipeptidyl-peptidase-4